MALIERFHVVADHYPAAAGEEIIEGMIVTLNSSGQVVLADGSSGEITFIGRIYRGYNISYLGSVFGLIWGFFDGLIGGAIFAWLYNHIAGCLTAKER